MLQEQLRLRHPETLVTFTRNPAVIKMISKVAREIYPLSLNPDMAEHALELAADSAVCIDGVVYEPNRYGEAGLYHGFDAADQPISPDGETLKQRFTGLERIGAALVVIASVKEEK